MDTRGIFQTPGLPADAAAIREALDTGDPLPAGTDPRSFAQVGPSPRAAHRALRRSLATAACPVPALAPPQVLLDLLSSLREPVLPTAFFPGPELSRGAPVEPWCAQVRRGGGIRWTRDSALLRAAQLQ